MIACRIAVRVVLVAAVVLQHTSNGLWARCWTLQSKPQIIKVKMQADCLQPRLRLLAARTRTKISAYQAAHYHNATFPEMVENYYTGCCVHLFWLGGQDSNLHCLSTGRLTAGCFTIKRTTDQIVIQLSKTYMLLSNTCHIILLLDILVNKVLVATIRFELILQTF